MQDLEKKKYNLGFINGWLSALARINDKTNHGYEFSLTNFESGDKSLAECLDTIFNPIYESYKIEKIDNPKEYLVNLMIDFWFFEFQEKPFSNISLIDKNDDFSLSDSDW